MFDRERAARNAEAETRNRPGTCQLWTRTMFGAPSAGDVDRDGDADAVDGWLSEPAAARHYDRQPPRGVPVAFSGGSQGYGHRALSLGGGKIRSTDMRDGRYAAGFVGTVTLDQIERSMGVRYLGWSETMSGQRIPLPAPAKPRPKTSRGNVVDAGIRALNAEVKHAKGARRTRLRRALYQLRKIAKVK